MSVELQSRSPEAGKHMSDGSNGKCDWHGDVDCFSETESDDVLWVAEDDLRSDPGADICTSLSHPEVGASDVAMDRCI